MAKKSVIQNPKTTFYEFGGPIGCLFVILGLPALTFVFYFICDEAGCPPSHVYRGDFSPFLNWIHVHSFWSLESLLYVVSWIGFQLFLYLVVPGPKVQGTELRNGNRLSYRINAFSCLLVTTVVVAMGLYFYSMEPFLWVAKNTLKLATSATLFSFSLALFLYVFSFRSEAILLAEGGNSGYPSYDFWMGRELNPRLFFDVDLKYFCELRPGLIGWAFINFCLAVQQYHQLGRVTNSMILVNLFQLYYVVDALWNERAILTTMDITTDGFGFMLVFGDLVWVPFTYSLQGNPFHFYSVLYTLYKARYLSFFPQDLSLEFLLLILGVKLIGFYIFRSSNGQKNAFRTDPSSPSVSHLKYITTESGSKLLVSGWWGMARHINYFGDWLMGLSWCLPCGFDSILPYFYAIYFAFLLMHRGERDDHKCRKKYKKDWDKYCQRVPSKYIPYVY